MRLYVLDYINTFTFLAVRWPKFLCSRRRRRNSDDGRATDARFGLQFQPGDRFHSAGSGRLGVYSGQCWISMVYWLWVSVLPLNCLFWRYYCSLDTYLTYSYRDGGLHIHPSVLSSLSASYTPKDLGYYDDLARNLDANLAEIDMESFRTADIHTLLTALPVMCTEPVQHSEVKTT